MGKNFYRSATMMNKVFEVIEAQRIFNLSKKNKNTYTENLCTCNRQI